MAPLRGSYQDRLLVERFSVEKQTVHVEDNGGWHVGELHLAWLTARGQHRLCRQKDAPLLGVRIPSDHDR